MESQPYKLTEMLLKHPWPGNLRELNRVIQTGVALTSGQVLRAEAILLDEIVETADAASSSSDTKEGLSSDLSLKTMEKKHIAHVLTRLGGNKKRAAKALGISRSTLDRKLR